jgi:hypothetical protein
MYVINMARNPDSEQDFIWDLLISHPPHPGHADQFITSVQDLLLEFLRRFQGRNLHLLGWYGQVTHDILVAAAQLQADIVCDSSNIATDVAGEPTSVREPCAVSWISTFSTWSAGLLTAAP